MGRFPFLASFSIFGLLLSAAPIHQAAACDGDKPDVLASLAELRAGGSTTPTLSFAPAGPRLAEPRWTIHGLLRARPCTLRGLSKVERAGAPVWDPSTRAFYASANGTLVRVEQDGRLVVVHEGAQGLDVDVRAAQGLVVSREPGDAIVLQRFGKAGSGRRVLLVGEAFFFPRLSPSGHAVAVSESRVDGGRVRVLDTAAPRVLALVEGNDPAWQPSGKRLLVTRVEHDGKRILAARLFEIDIESGAERALDLPDGHAPIRPAMAPGGDALAYVDAGSGTVHVMPWKGEGR